MLLCMGENPHSTALAKQISKITLFYTADFWLI